MYYLNYSSLAENVGCHSDSYLIGSSRFSHNGKELCLKKKSPRKKEISGSLYKKYLECLDVHRWFNIPLSYESLSKFPYNGMALAQSFKQYTEVRSMYDSVVNNPIRKYTLNKSKVRKKISALCRLRDAIKFIAFYSISFPVNAPDDVLYLIFNKWLTNCRTRYGLKSYLWVAERQKNGTLHFHLITVNRMDIRKVNAAMSNAIENEVKKGTMSWGNSSVSNYNGVDVDSPHNPKKRQNESRKEYRERLRQRGKITQNNIIKWISGYLTKYITKNNITFNRLPFHCSRDVSALFTTLVISDENIDEIIKMLPDEVSKYKIINNKNYNIKVFKFRANEAMFELIRKANENVYNYFKESNKNSS